MPARKIDDMTQSHYPSENLARDWPSPSLIARLRTRYATFKAERDRRSDRASPPLHCETPQGPSRLAEGEIAALLLTHDSRPLTPSFLAHYRSLGVSRFICVDDRSTDGTAAFLLAQPDVDLWTSTIRYRDADRGRLWREALIRHYGLNRWYVNVDSDEYLVYPGHEAKPLHALAAELTRKGQKRFTAPMLDLYPVGDLSLAVLDGADARMPWEIATHFDADGYRIKSMRRFVSLKGGLKTRKFDGAGELMKYPFLFWDEACHLGHSIHQPAPYDRNFAPPGGVLLHFKFFADIEKKVTAAVADQQYYAGAKEYQKILARLTDETGVSLEGANSRRYESVEQLVRLGFITEPN